MRTTRTTGFTLPVVLVAMTGLLVLLLGLITIVGLERQSSKAHADGYRAELAARSALSEARTLLSEHTRRDDFLVVEAPARVAFDDDGDELVDADEDVERPYLYLAKWQGDEGNFAYEPLFSTGTRPATTGVLELPADPGLPSGDEDRVSLRALAHREAPVLSWKYIENEEGVPVARYAYWVEDMEGYLDSGVAGNEDGEDQHRRAASLWPDQWGEDWPNPYPDKDEDFVPPWHAPGLNPGAVDGEPLLDQAALYTLEEGGETDDTEFDNELLAVRDFAATGDSLLAALDVPTPLQRDADGRLVDDRGRAVEENLTIGNRPYWEQPLVPPVEGIATSVVGLPKQNLNSFVEEGGETAVNRIADLVNTAFPGFDKRKGGFDEDYVKTLAASIIDYADVDGDATVKEGVYRGIDAYPLVSEYLVSYRWGWDDGAGGNVGVVRENGRLYVLLTVYTFAELWNAGNHPVSGEAQMNFETRMSPEAGAVPGRTLMDDDLLARPTTAIDPGLSQSGSDHQLSREDDGFWYFPPFAVELQPDEYVVVRTGEVRYKLDAGLAFGFVASPLSLTGDHGMSGYRMKWNGRLVDRVQGGIERGDVTVYYPMDTSSRPRQKTRATIGGYVFGEYGVLHDGMGDPRITYHTNFMQAANAYPANYSPWRRNVRLRIFNGNQAAIYGRVLPSEWPDGGHNSRFGSDGFYTTDQRINPDDARFTSGKPAPEPRKAVTRLSNIGRYFSESELGHVFDPVMWGAKRNPLTGQALDQLAVQAWVPEVRESDFPSATMGGGSTLRIGRPGHPRFDEAGLRAAGLLDLFHAGSAELEGDGVPERQDSDFATGPLVYRHGHVNINTAPRDVLRALAAGLLVADPALERAVSTRPSRSLKAPPTIPMQGFPPAEEDAADVLADAIIAGRPYASPSELAWVREETDDGSEGRIVFGNKELYPNGRLLQWNDAAIEETFARVYNSATVRSRNYRVHAIGQAIQPVGGTINVLSTRRKVFRVFADPGLREEDGSINPDNSRVEVLYEKDR